MVAVSAECRQLLPGRGWTSGDAGGCGWACDLRSLSFHPCPASSTTGRWHWMLRRLITQRSQVQILPPLPTFSQVRAMIIDHGPDLRVGSMSASLPTRDSSDAGLPPVRSTLVDVRRRSWISHLLRRVVTPLDLWVGGPEVTGTASVDVHRQSDDLACYLDVANLELPEKWAPSAAYPST